MKKIYFAIAACAMFAFAACNSGTDAGKTDSTMVDTATKVAEPVAAPADTTPKTDTAAKTEVKKDEKK